MSREQTNNDNRRIRTPPKKVDSSTKTWSPFMDNIVEMPITKKEKKDLDRQINDALYGERKIRRLSVFQKMCPQETIKDEFNVVI